MQPRDPRRAGRTVLTLCGVAVLVSVAFAPFNPANNGLGLQTDLLGGAALLVTLALCWLTRFVHAANRVAWAMCPFAAVVTIVVVDLMTADATLSALIFFLFPTLYGAALLPWQGASLMTLASVVGVDVVVGVGLPMREAFTNAGYMTAVLVTSAAFLARSTHVQAILVERLREQAAVDPLTGLVTRRVLDQAASAALSGADADDGTSLVLLDVDRFKSVNDEHGHPAGDAILVQLAGLLARRTRPADVVCRMGGDEIALLLPGCAAGDAHGRAEEVLADVRRHSFLVEGVGAVHVSVSIGLAHAPTHANDLRQLYAAADAAADAALYTAKRTGRDRVVAAPHDRVRLSSAS